MPATARGRLAAARGGVASTGSSSSPSEAALPTCRPRSTAAAPPAAARAALAAADATAVARRRAAPVAADFSLPNRCRRVLNGLEGIGHDSKELGRPRLQSRSGWKHFLERGPGKCVQTQDMGFQHVSSCFFVSPILGRTTQMIVLQILGRTTQMIVLQTDSG